LCVNGFLKGEFKHLADKGLTHALDFPQGFKDEWIKVILSRVHDMCIWLDNGPVKITKNMIHRVTRYPIVNGKQTMRDNNKEEITLNTGAIWNNRGMTISTIKDLELDFGVRVIAHKFYQLSRLDSVPCTTVNQAWKIVKKNHTYDLAELQQT
jgi:hypothetical protein